MKIGTLFEKPSDVGPWGCPNGDEPLGDVSQSGCQLTNAEIR